MTTFNLICPNCENINFEIIIIRQIDEAGGKRETTYTAKCLNLDCQQETRIAYIVKRQPPEK